MGLGWIFATLSLATAAAPSMDDDANHQAAFREIANRVAPLIERISDPEKKVRSGAQLGVYRITAKDMEGAKRALAQAADLALASVPSEAKGYMRVFVLISIAGSQDELGERLAAAATLARAGKAALEFKEDYFKILTLEMILDHQRTQDDRDAIAETARRLTTIIKKRQDEPFDPKSIALLKVQAKAGDVRGALQALLEAPTPPNNPLLDEKPDAERREEFRCRGLRDLLYTCRAGDEEVVSRIARLLRGMAHTDERNDALRALATAQARLKQFDEAFGTLESIDLKVKFDYRDPRHLLIDALLDLADDELEAHDNVGAQRAARKAEEILESFEKQKDQAPPDVLRLIIRFGSPLSRLVTIHARSGERAAALALTEKMPPSDRLKALEEIADLDDYAGHRDDAAGVRKQAVKLAREILIEIDTPGPPADARKAKPRVAAALLLPPVEPGDDPLDGPAKPREKTEAELAAEEAAAEAEAKKTRRAETMLAMIRLHVRMGDLDRAGELLKDAGEPKPPPTEALVFALGQSGDVAAALTRIDAISNPDFKMTLLTKLASGLNERRSNTVKDGGR